MNYHKEVIIQGKWGAGSNDFGLIKLPTDEPEDYEFWGPFAITTDYNGNIYIDDSSNFRIKKYDKEGNLLLIIKLPDYIKYAAIDSIAIDNNGNIYIAGVFEFNDESKLGTEDYVMKFSSAGEYLLKFGGKIRKNGLFIQIGCIRANNKNLYIQDLEQNSHEFITKIFDFQGNYINTLNINEIYFDSRNNLYGVSSTTYNKGNATLIIKKFKSSGELDKKINLKFYNLKPLNSPHLIGVDDVGNLYVLSGLEIFKFDLKGKLLYKLDVEDTARENDINPFPTTFDFIHVDRNGNVYIMIGKKEEGFKLIKYWVNGVKH